MAELFPVKWFLKGESLNVQLKPTRDKSVCGGMRKEPKILVGKNKGVQEGFFYLKKIKQGKARPGPKNHTSLGPKKMQIFS
ncbi:MAG: hypothetical protein CM1200mP30_14460 [Pseudomonadota bacterium]|nr:MAG: hypothetical protein CM1200mP30_14460 [Pseudomonadota bacterium]